MCGKVAINCLDEGLVCTGCDSKISLSPSSSHEDSSAGFPPGHGGRKQLTHDVSL